MEENKLPNFVILGSCRFVPYKFVAPSSRSELDPRQELAHLELLKGKQEKSYDLAKDVFYPAIDEADIVLVYNPDGIGKHTQKDIGYAESKGKHVIYLYKKQNGEMK